MSVRETITAALASDLDILVKAAYGSYASCTRIPKVIENIQDEECPLLFLEAGQEKIDENDSGNLLACDAQFTLWGHLLNEEAPDTALNELLAYIQTWLLNGSPQILGTYPTVIMITDPIQRYYDNETAILAVPFTVRYHTTAASP